MNALESTKSTRLLAVLLIAIQTTQLVAHHSFAAEYDANKPVTLKGAVRNMVWSNPHAWIYVDVKGPDGKVVNTWTEARTSTASTSGWAIRGAAGRGTRWSST